MTTSKTKELKQTVIGDVPADWGIMSVELALDNDWHESKDSVPNSEFKTTGRYPIIDQSKDYVAGYTDDEGRVYKDCIPLIVFGDHTRVLKYVDFPFVTGADGTQLLKVKKDYFDSKFFYYALKNINIPNRGYNRHYKILKEQIVPQPPKPEQEKIVEVLSKIQKVVETQEKIVANLRELKSATTTKLFREGLRGEPLKQTEIGEMPKSWQIKALTTTCEKPQYGYTESSSEKQIGPKFLRITDLTENGVDWGTVPYCKCSENDVIKHQLKAGDILVARIGATTGKNHLIVDCPKAVFASYLIRLRAKPGLVPEFLSNFMDSSIYWKQVRATKGQNLKGGMSGAVLSQIIMPFPDEPEQKEISNAITVMNRNIRCAVEKHLHARILFSSTLNQLMTGKVRV